MGIQPEQMIGDLSSIIICEKYSGFGRTGVVSLWNGMRVVVLAGENGRSFWSLLQGKRQSSRTQTGEAVEETEKSRDIYLGDQNFNPSCYVQMFGK